MGKSALVVVSMVCSAMPSRATTADLGQGIVISHDNVHLEW